MQRSGALVRDSPSLSTTLGGRGRCRRRATGTAAGSLPGTHGLKSARFTVRSAQAIDRLDYVHVVGALTYQYAVRGCQPRVLHFVASPHAVVAHVDVVAHRQYQRSRLPVVTQLALVRVLVHQRVGPLVSLPQPAVVLRQPPVVSHGSSSMPSRTSTGNRHS